MADGNGFVLPLDSPDATLAAVGGKARSLAELALAGFAVPPAFFVTTAAHRAAGAGGSLPPQVAAAVGAALRGLGGGAVAVRSSATAEDLEEASFAGQQDTYLGVEGEEGVLAAVEGCWASLRSERAVAYRAAHGIPEDDLAMGVVVQRMVDAETAGVAFTANPLTGDRHEIVVDAVRGLGDALVSGELEPDRYVVDGPTLAVKERRAVAAPVLDDARVVEVARTARAIARQAGAPRDVEWAWSADGLAVLQSRPITTLYPPLPLPASAHGLRVYVNTLLGQGVEVPLTPLGLDVHFLLQRRWLGVLSVKRPPGEVTLHAGLREFQDVTDLIADPRLRGLALGGIGAHDEASRRAILSLVEQGRLPERTVFTLRRKLRFLRTGGRALARLGAGLVAPETTRRRALRTAEQRLARAEARAREATSLEAALDGVAADVDRVVDDYWVGVGSLTFSAFVCHSLLNRLLPRWAGLDGSVVLELLRGIPDNVTTELNLALWALARELRVEPGAREALQHGLLDETAAAYLEGRAPAPLQAGLARFLDDWGSRGDVEIDIGRPRWRDDPTAILGTLSTYAGLDDPELGPAASHRRGAEESVQRAREVVAAVHARGGPLRAGLVRATIRRLRALYGTREFPKYANVRVLAAYRPRLAEAGRRLVAEGALAAPDDVFFVELEPLRRHARGEALDLRQLAAAGRAAYERELRRRPVPSIVLSTGEAFHGGPVGAEGAGDGDGLAGDPVAPGVAEGRVRVVHDPRTAWLEPGEILVCPRTDPGWTPLILTAGGVVMEVGGMTTHGSVVAREHGIPGVVLRDATARLETGDLVRVDGGTGRITVVSTGTS
jgi:pyruvate,water dikinase